jgi:hypothetical protein
VTGAGWLLGPVAIGTMLSKILILELGLAESVRPGF